MGGGSQQSSSTSLPIIPPYLNKLLKGSAGSWQSGMRAANAQGGLAGLLTPNPEQIAPLTGDELGNISQLQGFASAGGTPDELAAQKAYQSFIDTSPGDSAATQAAMRDWLTNVQPTVASSLGASGGGRGGELEAALASSQTQAYTPLAERDLANQLTAAGGLSSLGQAQSGNVQNAMNASDLQRQVTQSGNDAQFQDFLRRSGLIQQFTMGPLSQLGGSVFGQKSTSSSGGGQGKF
jgi:hypothetical protein